jgi:hypothetical protein
LILSTWASGSKSRLFSSSAKRPFETFLLDQKTGLGQLSIPIRAHSLHPMRLSQQLLHLEQDSAWMEKGLGQTTFSSSVSGAH